MPREKSSQLTEVETQVLKVLWQLGPSPVRVIHGHLTKLRDTNYSTTVKMLSVMLDKNLIRRDEGQRPHVYSAVLTQKKAQKRMLTDLIDKIYDGSATSLVMQAISSKRTSSEDLEAIRQMIEKIQGEE